MPPDKNNKHGIFNSSESSRLDLASDIRTTILIQSPKGGRFILWAILLLFIALSWWASISEVEEVTSGAGRVIPSTHIQIIQNLEGGILQEILVSVGDKVEKGQTLLRIDDTRYSAQHVDHQRQIGVLDAKIARLQAEILSTDFTVPKNVAEKYPDIVKLELDLYETELEEIATKISILQDQASQKNQELKELRSKVSQFKKSKELLQKELNMTLPLVKQGAVSEVEVLRLRRTLNEISGELRTAELQIPNISSQHNEAKRKIQEEKLSFQKKAKKELNEAVSTKNALLSNSITIQDKLKRTKVASPVKGTINQILINTVGGVIQPGMDLIEIVPLEDTLLIEAKISPADIAFLRPGQKAVVQFTAYDFTVYGGLTAKLEHISADSITDDLGKSYYLIRVRTDQNFIGDKSSPLPIIPGMLASVDILTGKKTVMSYLLNPILRAKTHALRER